MPSQILSTASRRQMPIDPMYTEPAQQPKRDAMLKVWRTTALQHQKPKQEGSPMFLNQLAWALTLIWTSLQRLQHPQPQRPR